MELKYSGVTLVVTIYFVALISFIYLGHANLLVNRIQWKQATVYIDKLHHQHNKSTQLWNLNMGYLNNIKVSILGDSTAFRTANALVTSLGNCETTMSERKGLGRTIDVKYFNKDNSPGLSFTKRNCNGCYSSVRTCDMFNITLEYFTFEKIFDKTVTGREFNTTIEFLIKYWWVKTGHPNVILHQATMVHDLMGKTNESMEYKYYRDFFSNMLKYTNKYNSTYFWSNSPKVKQSMVPEKYRSWTKNSYIKKLNDAVKTLLTQNFIKCCSKSSKKLNFGLDLYRWSENIPPNTYIDAVHHVSDWYKLVGNKLLTMYYIWKIS